MEQVFRRFNTFNDALAFLQEQRETCDFLRIVYSVHRPDPGDTLIEGQCYGPWCVDTDLFTRSWESVVATHERGERLRVDRASVERLQQRAAR